MNNSNYIKALRLLSEVSRKDKYIILGSVATLSYTQEIGYMRQIHDIDVIMDRDEADVVKRLLLNEGFELKTFIDKRMPFYKSLIKQAESQYLRFVRNNVAIEILSTQFIKIGNTLKFDLYPKIWAQIPKDSIVEQQLGGVTFTTLNLNLIWGIKQFLNNTLGRLMPYKGEQRDKDLAVLKTMVNVKEAKQMLTKCRLGYLKLSIRIPTFII